MRIFPSKPAFKRLCLVAGLMLFAGHAAAAESLQQAWDTALAVDRSLKAARENTAAAASLLEAAKSARLPNVVLEAGYTALDNTPGAKADFFGQSLQMPLGQKDSFAYKAMATLPLYTGGRIGRNIDAAAAGVDAAKLGEAADEENLKLRVAEAYVGVLRARRLLEVANSHVRSLESHERDVQNLLDEDLVAKNDLLSVHVALADARQRVLQVANAVDLAQAAYNRLLGRPLGQVVQLEELTPQNDTPALGGLTARALERRSELAALARQIGALHQQAAAVRGEDRPQVALSGGYNYQENRYQMYEGQWMVTLGVKWNVFDGGVVNHRASAIDRQAAALTEQREDLSSVIGLQVRQAWLDVAETRKRLAVTQSAIAQAEENLRVVRERYANGLSTNTEVLDAETMRVNSEANHAAALYDAALAGLRLKRAVGEL
ncbi:MAG: TolC family protein [Acidithiobacillus sp.]|jgi:outer membrane protein TolC|uniref:TolC family protein n=1 Tax=Acidithiobacillus sp. TaxID=1872118 RepID=UPI00355DCE1C